MAEVAQSVAANADRLLSYLVGRWEDIPLAAEEWETWDRFEQADYLVDWPVVESYMAVVQDYAAQDVLTPAQQDRYERLLTLVAHTRPLLERLMES